MPTGVTKLMEKLHGESLKEEPTLKPESSGANSLINAATA